VHGDRHTGTGMLIGQSGVCSFPLHKIRARAEAYFNADEPPMPTANTTCESQCNGFLYFSKTLPSSLPYILTPFTVLSSNK